MVVTVVTVVTVVIIFLFFYLSQILAKKILLSRPNLINIGKKCYLIKLSTPFTLVKY